MEDKLTGKQAQINVLVAEIHPVFTQGLTTALTESGWFKVLAEVTTGYDALMACQELSPDVMILDISLQGTMSGNDVIAILREKRNPIKIVAISGNEYELSSRAAEYGADRRLLKTADSEEVIQNILEVMGKPPRYDYLPES